MKTVADHRYPRLPLLALLSAVVVLVLIAPAVARAQAGVTLTVQLQDMAAQPLAGSTVRVIDAARGHVLAEARTTARGSAVFPSLRPGTVRVTVAGILADGTPLRLVGQDVDGIWVAVPQAAWTMALLVDVDGTVFPDLSLGGAGAADGADHAALEAGTFGSPPPATRSPGDQPTLTVRAIHIGLQPAAADAASGEELVLALGWMAIFCVALALVIVYGRRP